MVCLHLVYVTGIEMSMKPRKIVRIIEPQFSSEVNGIRWYRSLTPADTVLAHPFVALELFQNNHLKVNNPQPTSRFYRGVKLFSHIIHGNYSVRINQSQIYQTHAGDFIEIDTGSGVQMDEVFLPDGVKMEGFRLWIDQNSFQNSGMKVSIHARNEKRLRFQHGKVQVRSFSGFPADQSFDSLWAGSDLTILDIKISAETKFELKTAYDHHALVFVYQGRGYIGPYQEEDKVLIARQRVLLFDQGHSIQIQTEDTPISLLVVTAQPSGEEIPPGTRHSQHDSSILKI